MNPHPTTCSTVGKRHRPRLATAVLAASVAVAAVGLTVTPAFAVTPTLTAVAQHSQLCLTDPNQSATDGVQYVQNTCNTAEEQRFDFHPVPGTTNTYFVVNHSSGKCLDVAGISTADDAKVWQWACHGGTNQQWTLRQATATGNPHDFQLVAVHSGKCADVSGVSTATGAPVIQWTCTAASDLATKKNQVWRLSGLS